LRRLHSEQKCIGHCLMAFHWKRVSTEERSRKEGLQ